MEFRILGPLEVVGDDGPIALGEGRRRSLLAALLVHAGEPVSSERLVELLWNGGAPETAQKIVQIHVSELRKALGRDRIGRSGAGYVLDAAPEEVDATRFERLAEEGRRFLDAGNPEAAQARLADALALWRGPALADFAYDEFAQAAIGRLEELRLSAIEDRIEAELALGRQNVAEIESLVREEPLRERLRTHLMLALYRAGRQAEALQAYQDARHTLVEELGIEPGPALQRLEREILRQDPGLEAGAVAAAPAPGARKTVTAVFVDAVPEPGDPEVVAERVSALLENATAVLSRHGATVERVGGDGVAGLFGVPAVHEDDALRALRAAEELRGPRTRIAVGAGEVVAGEGTPAGLRPGSVPEPGEIVVSPEAERLADAAAVPRRYDTPYVGRDSELARLRQAFARVVERRTPALVTVLGPAGIGKSRLARELLRTARSDARVLVGRCLAYGEGITFWPVAEIVKQAFGDAPREAMVALAGPEVAEPVAAATGLGGRAAPPSETAWAVRRLLEELAREQPLVLVLDDLHWAEPTLLDLIEHVADLARDAPLLVLCLARPELLEDRPTWGGGKLDAETIPLHPLTADEAEALIANLAGEEAVAEGDRARIAATAEGNPLFLEQLLASLDEAGELTLPPTIHALMAARLDRLPAAERELLQRASVMGKEFWRAPVVNGRLSAHVDGLVRKDLIRPTRSALPGQEAYRFAHQLFRDVAYASLPKKTRAQLHEELAAWIAGAAGTALEEEEIVGYHLEQAALYSAELGRPDEELAARAAERLAAAGRRAYARGDAPAATSLCGRAAALLEPNDPARLELLPVLADLYRSLGRTDEAVAAIEATLEAGDERIAWYARLAQLRLTLRTDPHLRSEELLAEADAAIEALTRFGDERGLAEAWSARSWIRWLACRATETAEAALRSIEYARRAGDDSIAGRSTQVLLGTILFGPTPVAEGIVRCEQETGPERPLLVRATALRALAGLTAMSGRFDEARELLARDAEILRDLGLTVVLAHAAEVGALIELLDGDPAAAEAHLRAGYDVVAPLGDMAAPTFAAMIARALAAQGRDPDALSMAEESEREAAAEDLTTQVQWRSARAVALSHRGEDAEAERLAREAVAIAERTDFLTLHGDALAALATVTGDDDAIAAALDLYERKGNAAAAARLKTASTPSV